MSDDSVYSKRIPVVSKRHRSRGLQRTLSASDLIREAASGNCVAKKESSQRNINSQNDAPSSPQAQDDNYTEDTQSTGRSSLDPIQAAALNVSDYLNETLFIQLPKHEGTDEASAQPSFVANPMQQPSLVTLLPMFRPPRSSPQPPPPPPTQHTSPKISLAGLLPHPFFASQQDCQQCSSLKSQVETLQDDIEYIRNIALQWEHADQVKGHSASQSQQEQEGPASLASNQLTQVAARQRQQVEQMLQERVSILRNSLNPCHLKVNSHRSFYRQCQWQQYMQLKLAEFVSLNQDLSQKSSVRESEAMSLKQELRVITKERDVLAEELSLLRAQRQLHENQERELEYMKERLTTLEAKAESQQAEAIRSRDLTIADLTLKLDQVLTELELTKQGAYSQRRVIFPDSRH
jgi:hypothetical protein